MTFSNLTRQVKVVAKPLNPHVNLCEHDAQLPCTAIIYVHQGIPENRLADVAFDAFHEHCEFYFPMDFTFEFFTGNKKLKVTETHKIMSLSKYGKFEEKTVSYDKTWLNLVGEFIELQSTETA